MNHSNPSRVQLTSCQTTVSRRSQTCNTIAENFIKLHSLRCLLFSFFLRALCVSCCVDCTPHCPRSKPQFFPSGKVQCGDVGSLRVPILVVLAEQMRVTLSILGIHCCHRFATEIIPLTIGASTQHLRPIPAKHNTAIPSGVLTATTSYS